MNRNFTHETSTLCFNFYRSFPFLPLQESLHVTIISWKNYSSSSSEHRLLAQNRTFFHTYFFRIDSKLLGVWLKILHHDRKWKKSQGWTTCEIGGRTLNIAKWTDKFKYGMIYLIFLNLENIATLANHVFLFFVTDPSCRYWLG